MPASKPEPSRRIVLAGQTVAYALRRSARRSIGLSIDRHGLRVAAPQGAALRDIEAILRRHDRWILAKLAAWHQTPPPEQFPVEDGAVIFLLGAPLTVRLRSAPRAGWQFADDEIRLAVPSALTPAQVLEGALRDRARALFTARLAEYAPRLGVAPPPLRLSAARTRWGSCSASGRISLNWRLILMPLATVDYVVCHELAHLREMNHSPRFWSVVASLYPDWQAQRLALRQLGRQLPQF